MGSVIQTVGVYSPEKVLTNNDLERILALSGQETSDKWIVERTGIRKRNVASENETVEMMAVLAARNALDKLSLDVSPIEHVVFATNTGNPPFPNLAGYVSAEISKSHYSKISKNASGVDVYGGCGGINSALMIADNSLNDCQFETVLVIGAEKLSDVTDYSDRGTCILFGDGASAYILSRNSNPHLGFRGHFPRGDGSKRDLIKCVTADKVTLYEALSAVEENRTPVKTSGRVLKMDGKKVFAYVKDEWENLFAGFVENKKLNPDSISFEGIFGISGHLANYRCFESVEKKYPGFLEKCGLNDDKEMKEFFCNTSTASQGRRTMQLIESAPGGSYLLMHGYGSGLQSCANLYRKPFA